MHLCSEHEQPEVLEEMLKIGCDNLDAKDLVIFNIIKLNIF
jgi:hypothetical protein